MNRVMSVSLLVLAQALGAQEIDGYWAYGSPGEETVFRFSTLTSGEVEGRIVQKPGADRGSAYFCDNPQFDGQPLLEHPWIWGLRPRRPGFWSGGLAVDTRNPAGNLFYCQATVDPERKALVLESVAGLGAGDRTLVLVPWVPPPPRAPPGNLLADLWTVPPENPAQPLRPRPVLNRTADSLVFGTVYYGTALVLVALTLLVLLRF